MNLSDQLRQADIETLELSVRSINGLTSQGIRTIGDLVDYYRSGQDWAMIPNIGKRSRQEIIEAIQNLFRAPPIQIEMTALCRCPKCGEAITVALR